MSSVEVEVDVKNVSVLFLWVICQDPIPQQGSDPTAQPKADPPSNSYRQRNFQSTNLQSTTTITTTTTPPTVPNNPPKTTAAMHLMYLPDANGTTRSYTLKKVLDGQVTKSAHPARFSPDDKWSRHRIAVRKRFAVLLAQQSK